MAHRMTPLVPEDSGALKRNNFDALRLGLALLVVWSHCFALWFGTEETETLSILSGGVFNSGNVGVLGFFTISGFLITLSWQRAPSPGAYLKKRIQRIYPGYLVATLVCSLLIVPTFSSRAFGQLSGAELAGLASNLLLRNYIIPSDAFHGGAVNGALWSIPYEAWCYVGVMALGLIGLIRRAWLFPLLALAVMLVRVWLDLTGRQPGGGMIGSIIGFPYFWFNVLPPFLIGASVLVWRRLIPRNIWLMIGLVIATLGAGHLPLPEPLPAVISRFLLPPALAYLIFFLAFSPTIKAHGAARYGDFSYGAYLYAFPIQQMLAFTLKGKLPFAAYIPLSMIGALLGGLLSWNLVERHFLGRVRHASAPLQREAAIVAP